MKIALMLWKSVTLLFLGSVLIHSFLSCSPSSPELTDGGTPERLQSGVCSIGNCGPNQVCHPGLGCRSACKSDKDCSKDGRVCQLSSGRCYGCLGQSDCPEDSTCRSYQCHPKVNCKSSKECPTDQVCDVTEGVCVVCQTLNDCNEGEYCQQGICVPVPPSCTSDKDCKAYNLLCNTKAQRCIDCKTDDDCSGSFHCKTYLCVRDICTAGESKCDTEARVPTRIVCKSNGSGWESKPCPNGEFCKEGACTSQVCQPKSKSCKDGKVVVCLEDGSGFSSPTACAPDQFCKGGTCNQQLCKPREAICDGNTVKTCKPDGSGYETKACTAKEYCKEGACLPYSCIPGEKKCDGNSITQCKQDGSGVQKVSDCPSGTFCDKGACAKQSCQPGTKQCQGNTAQTCNSQGSAWTDQPCASSEYCEQGTCKKQICTPNEKKCASSTEAKVCSSNGSQLNSVTCKAGETCEKGECKRQICTPKSIACKNGTTAQTCDAKGFTWVAKACGPNQYCDTGKCVQGSCPDGKQQSCYTGPGSTQGVGPCKAGTQTCTKGTWSACQGEVVPQTEVCDGKDNDCSGTPDDNIAQIGKACQSSKSGVCQPGTTKCKNNQLECEPKVTATPEVCDGKDNDCNGQVDDGLFQACYTGPTNTKNVGVCSEGKRACNQGSWGTCIGDVTPSTEVCDKVDNDCDGQVDENLNCPTVDNLPVYLHIIFN